MKKLGSAYIETSGKKDKVATRLLFPVALTRAAAISVMFALSTARISSRVALSEHQVR